MTKNNPLEIIEAMYNAHYSYLKNHLIGLTKSDEEADDVIQELFSKILKEPQKVLEVDHFRSWLIKSAKNMLLDFYKKKRPGLLKDEKIMESILIHNNTPEDDALINDQLEMYLNNMSTTDKAILLAKEYHGYKYEEISELLNIPVQTLKSRVFRIRKKMIKERDD